MRRDWDCCCEFGVRDLFVLKRGLIRVKRCPESAPHLVEDAVKYIIFLVDANTLFDLALGMYDFSLVLMIAQYAQKVS